MTLGQGRARQGEYKKTSAVAGIGMSKDQRVRRTVGGTCWLVGEGKDRERVSL